MGSKRVGLARIEALLENLKREINWGSGSTRSQCQQAAGYGIHEYFEVVSLSTSDDNDVSVSLSKYLPAGAVLMDAALVVVEKATSAHGDVALEVHSAAIAADSASAGTEIIGADTSGDKSIPDADLDCSSDGTLGDAVVMATTGPLDRAGAATYFHVVTKEDCSSMAGSPKVGVYIKWMGARALDA